MESFLQDWETAAECVKPATLQEKPQFEQAVYSLFEDFFAKKSSLDGSRYAIIQESVCVYLSGSDLAALYRLDSSSGRSHTMQENIVSQFVVQGFRPCVPRLAHKNKRMLYLTPGRLEVLVRFLTGKKWLPGTPYSSFPNGDDLGNEEQGDIKDRLRYLNTFLDVLPGHFGRGWHFETHPHVIAMILGRDLKTAVIRYREGYYLKHALMRHSNEEWVIVDAHVLLAE